MTDDYDTERPIALATAITILCRVHTRDDYDGGFIVEMGATPRGGECAPGDYARAWRALRHAVCLPVEPPYDPSPRKSEKIVAAAIFRDHVIYSLPAPARHGDVGIHQLRSTNLPPPFKGEQGFLTSTGRFVDRKTAWHIAERASQLIERAPTGSRGTLFSEDLW